MLRLTELRLSIYENRDEMLPKLIAKKLKIPKDIIKGYNIFKESIDARKGEIYFVYTVDVEVEDSLEKIFLKKGYTLTPNYNYNYPQKGYKRLENPPVIVGTGPAGLFCGLILSQMGYNPIIIERGEDVVKRSESVERFWREGILNSESNVQFG
ncbi:FAD binding domain [Anaerobranca californiensis DSM 14826]|uniref:FAD binding domain n=1 Tax=Anaerobranca californiensis DSM 14826 TaxID=1120989 RepID=A0A1M6MNC0_9FIRM|nr:FAD binding domain [Anaerobranca californiensis DSM 14826]